MTWTNIFHICFSVLFFYHSCVNFSDAARLSDLKATRKQLDSTVPKPKTSTPLNIDFIVDQPTTPKPKPRFISRKKRCCAIGREAAVKGYTCYVKRTIAQIRVNMPQRQKMKMMIKGDKWDYSFARKMEYCAKTVKSTRKFNRCCDKVTRQLDNEKFKRK